MTLNNCQNWVVIDGFSTFPSNSMLDIVWFSNPNLCWANKILLKCYLIVVWIKYFNSNFTLLGCNTLVFVLVFSCELLKQYTISLETCVTPKLLGAGGGYWHLIWCTCILIKYQFQVSFYTQITYYVTWHGRFVSPWCPHFRLKLFS